MGIPEGSRPGVRMFVVLVKYRKSLDEVDARIREHRAYLDKYYATGDLVCSGPQKPREGGVILARTGEKGRLEEILAQDPFVLHGIAEHQIIEFNPIKFSSAFTSCL